MSERNAIEKLARIYDANPTVRALIQLIMVPIPYGIGSAVDDALRTRLESLKEKRLRMFFDQLAMGEETLTEEVIERDDFLHAYFATLKAAVNTRREEKIRLFARLLLRASVNGNIETDKYDEFLAILDEISIRELHVLYKLKDFEDNFDESDIRKVDKNETFKNLQKANSYWQNFQKTVKKDLGIDSGELSPMLTRLNRTGLYETIVGSFWGYLGGRGVLTSLFSEFIEWIDLVGSKDKA